MENKTETVSDNELIAEFMGGHMFGSQSIGICWEFDSGFQCDDEDLKYKTSWSWLMPVVEKIQFFAHVKIENTQCLISVNGTLVTGIVGGSNIENVYKAVVEFIKWYNHSKT